MPPRRDDTTARSPAAPPTAAIPESNPWCSVAALAEWLNAGASAETFSQHAIRHYVREAHRNGLGDSDAVRRIGSKVLLHKGRFAGWLEGAPSSNASRSTRLRRKGAA